MDDLKRLRACFFHVADLDGHASGAIFRMVARLKGWENTKLIPYNYGYDIDLEALKDADVYFLDCTPSPINTWAPKIAAVAANIFVCDHHKTALEDPAFQQYLSQGLSRVGKQAGCALAWEFWRHDLGALPTIIRLLSQYDVWDKGDQLMWESVVMPVQYGMKAQVTDPMKDESNAVWDKVFADDGKFHARIIDQGNTIYQYEKKRLEINSKAAFEAEFAGKRAICLNTCTKSSQAFEAVYDSNKHDIMFAWTSKPNKAGELEFNVSCYSTNPRINCGEILKQYGGGGHPGAAGAVLKGLRLEKGVLKVD